MNEDKTLGWALFALRMGLAILFLVWALDKLVNVEHGKAVFGGFYGQELSETIVYAMGALQLLLVLAFAAGKFKTITYGALLLMHIATTVVSLKMHGDPFAVPNILFWANWPILGGLIALFLLRNRDTMLSA